MRISDIMTRVVHCIEPDSTLAEAARLMDEHDIGALAVAEDREHPIGVITDRDIVIRALAGDREPNATPVRDVMTTDVITCDENDTVNEVAECMESEQIRRVLITDGSGRLCGIVSLGDLATRTEQPEMTEEVLEEVSWPGHTQGRGTPRRFAAATRFMHKRGGIGMKSLSPIAIGAAAFTAGAVCMYLCDPARGRRRRALLRDKFIHLGHCTSDQLGKTSRYAKGKLTGLMHHTKSLVSRNHIDDWTLRERVRSVLGRNVSHPHAIEVNCSEGICTLSGDILSSEVKPLISCVSKISGVRSVENHMTEHERRGNVPSLQGGRRKIGRRIGARQELWSPTTRLLGILGGGALLAFAIKRRDAIGAVGGAVGFALATRSITNVPARRLIGIGSNVWAGASRGRGIEVQKDININADVEQVFDFFAKYTNFPHFMSRVLEVRESAPGSGRSHWVVRGPAGMRVSWDAQETICEPNKTIGWRSLPGSMVDNAGIIRFESNPAGGARSGGGTRVNIKLSYNPPGGALGHAMAMLFGADAKSELDADLLRAKTMIETGHPPHDAAQPGFGRLKTAEV